MSSALSPALSVDRSSQRGRGRFRDERGGRSRSCLTAMGTLSKQSTDLRSVLVPGHVDTSAPRPDLFAFCAYAVGGLWFVRHGVCLASDLAQIPYDRHRHGVLVPMTGTHRNARVFARCCGLWMLSGAREHRMGRSGGAFYIYSLPAGVTAGT